jgi:hypothetical protein
LARPGAFKSEKRKKELNRLKKQEEKRQKRVKKDVPGQPDTEGGDTEGAVAEESGTSEAVKE